MKNKKNIIWGTLVALFIAGLFSSCIIVSDGELENFRFVNDHILECNYSGFITKNNIKDVTVYDNHGNVQGTSYTIDESASKSRVTIILSDVTLRRGWRVDVEFEGVFNSKTYEVYYK